MNISQFYGKKIVSTSGKKGYIISVYASANKIEYLLCADADEKEFKVDIASLISVGNEVVFEDRETAMKEAKPVRLGRVGFNEAGKLLGVVEDYIFKAEKLTFVKIGNKKYPADSITVGDAVIVKGVKKVKSDVFKDGKVIIKKGTPLTGDVLNRAAESGEYIQTNLKSL